VNVVEESWHAVKDGSKLQVTWQEIVAVREIVPAQSLLHRHLRHH
jgi:hypothetical protein